MINTDKKTTLSKGRDSFNRSAWNVVQDGRTLTSFPIGHFYGAGVDAYQYALSWVAKKYRNPITGRGPKCLEDLEKLPRVRVPSLCGPCLTGYYLVRRNKQSATVAFLNGREISIKRVSSVHFEPCGCCSDYREPNDGQAQGKNLTKRKG